MTDISKKLSLEERLSLAAKKSKKKTKKSSSPAANDSNTPEQNLEKSDNSDKINAEENDGKGNKMIQSPAFSNHSKSLETSSPSKDEIVLQQEPSGACDSNDERQWKRQIDFLNSLKHKEPWSNLLSTDVQFSNVEDFLIAIEPALQSMDKELRYNKEEKNTVNGGTTDQEKDELITQLRYEGEKLAETELRQNNTIKSLRKKIGEMDNDIKVTQEELFKKIDAYEQLFNSHENLQAQLSELEASIKDLNQENLRLKDVVPQLEEKRKELEKMHSISKDSNLNFAQREKSLLTEIELLKNSSQEQVTQLETRLEKLRIELDRSSKNNSSEINDNFSKESEESLKRELEYLKTSSSHLENSLINKISELEAQSQKLEQSNKQLNVQLLSLKQSNETLEGKVIDESREKKLNAQQLQEIQQINEKLQNTLQDSIEDYKLLQKKYEIRNDQMEPNTNDSKFGNLLDAPDAAKDNMVTPSATEEDWMYPPNVSQISPMETPMDFENSSLQKEADDISDRPPIEDDKLSLNDMDIPDEAVAMVSPAQEINSNSKNTNSMNHRRRSTQVDFTGQMNAHMISKLGAEIRRYEAELVSLQNNCERLLKEKTEASNEILKLLEDNGRVKCLSHEKYELEKKLDEVQQKLDTSLEILGEKTERVEELENDVADLKEMMQQQVQQMADMQERFR